MSRRKRKTHRVSVVVRTKNRPQLLDEALASLAAQTHEDLEAIVVNDGGEDVSAVIDRWKEDLDIIHEHLDPGRGRCAAANRGIELATGTWLAFLDDDDVWLPDGVALLVAELGAGDEVVYGRVGATAFTDDEDGMSPRRFQIFGRPFDADALMFENFIPIIGCLLPLHLVREVGGFDEDLECFEDWDLFLKLSPLVPFTFVDAEVAEYRIFGDGFITGGGGQERQHSGRTQLYTKYWDRLSPEVLSRMQYHAKAEIVPEAVDRETASYKVRVGDLERGVDDLRKGVADLKEQIADRDGRLEELWGERQAIDADRDVVRREYDAEKAARVDLEDRLAREPTATSLVSVIIVNYNGRHHLELCLPALAETEFAKIEVILVDNGSEDDSVAWVRENHPEVRLLEMGANLGFGEANRRGILAAEGRYVALLNSDTVVEPGWLHVLLRELVVDPEIGAACSTLRLLEHPEILNGRGGGMSKLGYGYDRHFGCPYEPGGQEEDVREVLFPTAAAMLMRRRDFFESGGFDPKMFMYHEDVDLGWRLWLLGLKVVVCRDSVVRHHFGGTTVATRGLLWRERLGSRHAVRTIFKNYEVLNVARALKGLLKLWLRMGAWRHILHVAAWNAYRLPSTLRQRRKVQKRRRISDRELFERGLISIAPYPAPNPEIPLGRPDRDAAGWATTPFLSVGRHSAIGRLGYGWYEAHQLDGEAVRPFCGDARCRLKVGSCGPGRVEVDLHVPPDAVRGGSGILHANGDTEHEVLTGEAWQTLGVEGVEPDSDGLVEVRLQTSPFRPHLVFTNWDFRRLGGIVRDVRFVPGKEVERRPYTGVSVVITTYKRWPILKMTLDALRAQDWPDLQVVVMDDGSSDETWLSLQVYAAEYGDDFRLTIETQENSGQGVARNNSLRLVEEDLVLFLGDDIIPEPGTVRAHVEKHNEVGQPAAVVGFTDWYRKDIEVTPFMEMVNFDGHQFGYAFMEDGADQPFTCFYTSNISIDRKILGEAPFDPAFSSYGWEDVELGYRLSLRGVRIIYEKAARAGHHHDTTVRSFYRRQLQVGRTHHDLLALHPELLRHPSMPPERPPKWYRFTGPFVRPLVALVDALDRRRVKVPRKILHHLMMIGFYRGRAEVSAD